MFTSLDRCSRVPLPSRAKAAKVVIANRCFVVRARKYILEVDCMLETAFEDMNVSFW